MAGESRDMNKRALLGVLAIVLVAASGCVASLPLGESGSIAMLPFTDKEQGIRGNALLGDTSDWVLLNQESFQGTREELAALAIEQTDLIQIPRSYGTFQGAFLTWDLYRFTTRVAEAGPDLFHIDLAVAQGTGGERQYLVVLIARPMDYAANPAKYRTVLDHALYAFEPLE
jgi:hypothetical protein